MDFLADFQVSRFQSAFIRFETDLFDSQPKVDSKAV